MNVRYLPGLSAEPHSKAAMLALWNSLCDDPGYAASPFKFETTAYGQIVLSGAKKTRHSVFQANIARLLHQHAQANEYAGQSFTACAKLTAAGIKVPDVTWASIAKARAALAAEIFESAPEICVEVLSSSNDPHEIEAKITLYFEAGAEEVWICDNGGRMRFLDAAGTLNVSRLLSDFPLTVKLLQVP